MMGYMCGPRLYEFEGCFFEYQASSGPWPLRQNGEPRKSAGKRFWKMISCFDKLTDEQKQEYRVGGGCIKIG